jgi:hypothetical protein
VGGAGGDSRRRAELLLHCGLLWQKEKEEEEMQQMKRKGHSVAGLRAPWGPQGATQPAYGRHVTVAA